MRLALVSRRPTPTNDALARVSHAFGAWEVMTPETALATLRPGDVALGRLDVLPTLDGVDDGLWALGALARWGVLVLNEPVPLIAAHDKLLTARLLRRRGVAHPRTHHVREGRPLPIPDGSAVVKPRFGSWGRDVFRCDDADAFRRTLELVRKRAWYRRHGALVQELVPPRGHDLRVLVAAGAVVGAVSRVAAPGEWRTNIALGGVRRPVSAVPRAAAEAAVAAAEAVGAAFVGVDLLPGEGSGWVVLEVNGAVEFNEQYARGDDIFTKVAATLAAAAARELGHGAMAARPTAS